MIFKRYFFITIALVAMLGFQSCNSDDSNTARVQLKLVDTPGDYLEVNVEIVDIQYNSSDNEDGWMSFGFPEDYPINVDLTELIAGNSLLLTDEIIPAGMLKQIRLVLSDNNSLVIEGEAEPVHLDTPSAQQSGLKLNLNTVLEPGFSYTFILDWDVQKSVVEAGNSGMYNLKPVIRVSAEVNSGSIMGNVTGDLVDDEVDGAVALSDVTVMVFTTGDVEVGETLTNENGDFLMQGLEAGDYKLKIIRDGFQEYVSSDINVTVGTVQDVGTIELVTE